MWIRITLLFTLALAACLVEDDTSTATSEVRVRCGDNRCEGTEACDTCPQDCGVCPPVCGDGACNGDESCDGCPEDCGSCDPRRWCGDGTCELGYEQCSWCSEDCGPCPTCGDGVCELYLEWSSTCPADCPCQHLVCSTGLRCQYMFVCDWSP